MLAAGFTPAEVVANGEQFRRRKIALMVTLNLLSRKVHVYLLLLGGTSFILFAFGLINKADLRRLSSRREEYKLMASSLRLHASQQTLARRFAQVNDLLSSDAETRGNRSIIQR